MNRKPLLIGALTILLALPVVSAYEDIVEISFTCDKTTAESGATVHCTGVYENRLPDAIVQRVIEVCIRPRPEFLAWTPGFEPIYGTGQCCRGNTWCFANQIRFQRYGQSGYRQTVHFYPVVPSSTSSDHCGDTKFWVGEGNKYMIATTVVDKCCLTPDRQRQDCLALPPYYWQTKKYDFTIKTPECHINAQCEPYCRGDVKHYGGYCENGVCKYTATENCPNGCSNGQCNEQDCRGTISSCCRDTDCKSYCSGKTRYFNGWCPSIGGQCNYDTQTCPYNCEDGKCVTGCSIEWVGDPWCSGNNIMQGQKQTDCSVVNKVKQTCGTDQKCQGGACVSLQCPTCPEPSEWGSCLNGEQTRTNYECDASTRYKCESYTETKECSTCGNNICEAWENSQSCPGDCPIVPQWGWIAIAGGVVGAIALYKKKR